VHGLLLSRVQGRLDALEGALVGQLRPDRPRADDRDPAYLHVRSSCPSKLTDGSYPAAGPRRPAGPAFPYPLWAVVLVRDIMSTDVLKISESASIGDLTSTLTRHRIT